MADPATIRGRLQEMGFSDSAARYITDDQGMNEWNEFRILTDDEVTNLCRVVRKPGGTMTNPLAAQAGQAATVPNLGISVSLRAENNLKLMCYFLRYKERTSRVINYATAVTLPNVRALREHRQWEDDHKDAEAPEINTKDWSKTIEAIREWLRDTLGTTKIPLAYVIRDEINPPAALDNQYTGFQDDLLQGPRSLRKLDRRLSTLTYTWQIVSWYGPSFRR